MFSRQTPTLDNALWQGGLSAAQAHVISNALGQCRATLEHRGPIAIDYSSPDMKLIKPELAQIQFPEIQLQPPEILPPRPSAPDFEIPEELPPYEPNPLPPKNHITYVTNNPAPDAGGGGSGGGGGCCVPQWLLDLLRWAGKQWEQLKRHILGSGGEYIRVDVIAQNGGYNVNLDVENDSLGNICTFGDDKIKGLDKEEFVESISDELDDYVGDYLEDPNSGTSTTVVSGIQINNNKLQITTRTVRVLTAGTPNNDSSINLTEC